jgi:collagen type VII alpha
MGATGSAGAVGMNFRGMWSIGNNYALNDAVTYGGSTYLAQSPGANFEPDLYSSYWTVIAQAGGSGSAGATGAAATMSVGTVTTLAAGSPATVTNGGSSQAAVLNFGIPQGATGATGSGGGGTSSGNFAAVYHSVSDLTTYYSVNLPNASANETSTGMTTGVLAWVPAGCSATQLNVYSQQSNTITVTLRVGTPGSMSASTLTASVSSNSYTTSTGTITVTAGQFIDYEITGASGTGAGVWTALTCQ